MGMDGGGYPVGGYAPAPGASGRAITALILGVASFCCCNLLGPVAWFLGMAERKAIREGQSPAAGDGFALGGMILGIIGTILLVLGMIAVVIWLVMGGVAVLLAALGNR
jgi:hypothetical protein